MRLQAQRPILTSFQALRSESLQQLPQLTQHAVKAF
jgi:hypothetical protein